jgi:hypothetical protein
MSLPWTPYSRRTISLTGVRRLPVQPAGVPAGPAQHPPTRLWSRGGALRPQHGGRGPGSARVGNGILFRKNSAKLTRNGFRYSAEEGAHSEAFRVPRKSQFRSSERNGMEWIPRKNEVLQSLHSPYDHSGGL